MLKYMKISFLNTINNGTSTGQDFFISLNIRPQKTQVRDKVCPVITGQGLSP